MSYIILYDYRNTKHRIKIKLFIKISIIYGISNLKSKKNKNKGRSFLHVIPQIYPKI